jgi:hypothetical protein
MITLAPNRKIWRHKSVRALLREAGGSDPVEIIRSRTKEIVEWAKGKGWTGPPFNPLRLASLRGIRSRKSETLFSAEAQLTPMDGKQLLLEFNPDRPSGRKNYSISHELVHTLFDDCFEMVHHRKMNRAAFDPEQEIEHLCQVGAAEFLMPEGDFLADLEGLAFSLRSIAHLSLRYDASREAVARRMLALSGRTAALVFLSRRLKPIEIQANRIPVPEPKMRILYTVPTPDFPIFLPEHKSASDDSCVYRITAVDEVADGRECWNLPGFGQWSIEAMALPIPDDAGPSNPSILALIQPHN